jgi:aminodeoxyfutalosine synthase
MILSLIPRELRPIAEKVAAGTRISEDDALVLYSCRDINALGTIADVVRRRINAGRATFILNQYINYSNLCILSCQFCAFAAKKADAHAFEFRIDEIIQTVKTSLEQGVTEVHMVGGLHPTLKGDWYLELLHALKSLKESTPAFHIKAFTAVEIRHLAKRVFKKSIPETLALLHEAGLDSLTGGGAEIFDQEIRDQICLGKETADEWLDIHRTWHRMGNRSTCTMLFGHVESLAQGVDHMRRLRELQDETHGFTSFIPYAFVPEGTTRSLRNIVRATAFDQLRTFAVSRIFIDNIDHLTAYWISTGLPLAQTALNYGADDLHGTIMEEKIFHMAGSKTPKMQTVEALERAIVEAGFEPYQRNSFYQIIQSTHRPLDRAEASPAVQAAA